MRILFTGVSSFTGCWFANKLAAAGHHVVATTRGALQNYSGLRRMRLEYVVQAGVELLECCAFGDERFIEALPRKDMVCHHGAEVSDYKSLNFDINSAVVSNTRNARQVFERAADVGVGGFLVTGSVSEQSEGLGEAPTRAFSPYALSKGLSWQVLSFWADITKIPVAKFVIPNPFGPLEEARFCAYLVHTWARDEIAYVKTPEYIRDNIPVDRLADCYIQFLTAVSVEHRSARAAPSGYVESQGRFAERFARELGPRLGLKARLEFGRQTDFQEPVIRINSEPALANWDEAAFWDDCADYYRRTYLS